MSMMVVIATVNRMAVLVRRVVWLMVGVLQKGCLKRIKYQVSCIKT